MKNIGKIAVLAMTLALAFALSACGGSASSSAASSASAASTSASAASTSASAASTTASDTSASASAAASTSASSAAVEAAGGTYVNDAFGLSFTCGDGWVIMGAEDIASQGQTPAIEGGSIELVAVSEQEQAMVTVMLGKAEANKTADQQVDEMVNELQGKAAEGVEFKAEKTTLTFGSREMPVAKIAMTTDGQTAYTGFAVDVLDDAELVINVTAATEQGFTDAFESFAAAAK